MLSYLSSYYFSTKYIYFLIVVCFLIELNSAHDVQANWFNGLGKVP